MKKFIYILTSIILACTSCTGELGLDDGHKKDGFVLTIYNAPLTKAIDNTGEAYERELRTLDIFFYPKGETAEPCVFYHHEDLTDTFGQADVDIYVVEDAIRKIFPTQNLCDIFVIANLPESVKPDNVVFEAESEDTRLDRLEAYVLQNADPGNADFDAEYDAINKPFVMAGLGVGVRDSKKNAEGTISLVRASSKVTISVAIPDYLDVEVTKNTPTGPTTETVRMVPSFEDKPLAVTMNVAFHNGIYKGYLNKEVDEAVGTFYFSSSKQTFTYSKTLPANESTPSRRVYTCDVPFYTYAHQWAKGAADAPYMTFEMKWGADKGDGSVPIYETYYYQILINGADRTFLPNHWYDMFVNVGVIGSTIEIKPIIIDHLSFFVLDWSDTISGVDHPDEDVVLDNYTYFNVLTKRLELDNVTSGVIEYKASHKIDWALDTSDKNVENVAGLSTTSGAFYIDCGSSNDPQTKAHTGYTLSDDENGNLTYSYNIPANMYSPMYVYLTLWLELDGQKGMSAAESAYSESVVIVQYPSIYITPYRSTEFSVFINRYNKHNEQIRYNQIQYDNYAYNLGQANGTGNGNYMYSISVSSFKSNDKFTINNTSYNYIIGDPRSRTSDTNLNDDNFNMNNSWRKDREGDGRILQYYYPTMRDAAVFQVISPKFRVASFLGGYSNACTTEGAAMRCASYQEEGLPAGRWRLPTTAEILFVISLQQKDLIQDIFYKDPNAANGNWYYSSTHQVQYNGANAPGVQALQNTGSVRCIYDEWYWGTQPEARTNNSYAGGYEFTWGDEQITW